ncbi:MAG TPA: hypothetical protein VFV09_07880 [Actinomycetota bacterium]|nr:hypothetical protein [Actinomycetota bacterium]
MNEESFSCDRPEAAPPLVRSGRRRGSRGLQICLSLGLSTLFTLGATSGYAYWAAGSGSGSASVATATMQPVVISALSGGDGPSSTLVPGGSADVFLRVTNPNPVAVQVFSVEPNGAIYADAAFPGCTTTGVTFDPPSSPLTPTVSVGAGSSLLIHLDGAASMDYTSSSGCQGARFHIPVTLTVRQ